MPVPQVNYLAVLVAAVVVFILGGVWYSPAVFAKKWVALQGKDPSVVTGMAGPTPAMFIQVFICGLLISWGMAVLLNHFVNLTLTRGVLVAVLAWLSFAAATSYGSYLFSMKPKQLWAIDSGFNLVSFVLAAVILTLWR
jgi:hypothetical protein